ncbi:MAG: alpha-glucosidase [Micavibrio sp.]|nr:alpha-glucosidase [Micavibrio sp.]HCK32632.1 alpha-glucosidase [Rhodospirillaceae bacterium]
MDKDWWKKAVFYQVYPRSFQDSTGSGTGDLAGISNHLEYLRELGIEGLWISPFLSSPQKDFGYDVSDYRKVDPMFGTTEEYERLIEKAARLDIKIIMDLVLSHTSDKHDWFVESRSSRDNSKSDWYVWAEPKEDGTPPNNWQSVFGGSAWQYDTRREQYYLHNFLKEQPDLNYHNPDVQQECLDIMKYWLDKGVSGFRLDVFNYLFHDEKLRDNPPNKTGIYRSEQFEKKEPYGMQMHVYDRSRPEMIPFIARVRELLDKYPEAMTLAELADDNSYKIVGEYTSQGRLDTAYNTSLMGGINKHLKSSMIEDAFAELDKEAKDAWPSWAFSNHDVVRVATRWGCEDAGKPQTAKLFMAILLTLRGTAFIYQGEELGLPEANIPYEKLQDPWGIYLWPEWQGRDGCRTPMPWTHDRKHCGFTEADEPWLPIPASHATRAVDLQEKDTDSVLNFTKDFIAWRKSEDGLTLGNIVFEDFGEDILVYKRGKILCVFNLRDKATQITTNHNLQEVNLFGAGLTDASSSGGISLGAFGFGFFRILD